MSGTGRTPSLRTASGPGTLRGGNIARSHSSDASRPHGTHVLTRRFYSAPLEKR
jgi:hypothetical protein